MSDQTVVIVGAKRTPIGSFQGQFNDASAVDLGAAAIAGAIEPRGHRRRRRQRSHHGLRAAGRPRPGAGAAGRAQSGRPRFRGLPDRQQGLRLRA